MNLLCSKPATTGNNLQDVLREQAKKISESIPLPVTCTGNTSIDPLCVNLAALKLVVNQSVEAHPRCVANDVRTLDSTPHQQLCDLIFKANSNDGKLNVSEGKSQSHHGNLTVLAGPHGSGKTTLCLSLVSQLLDKNFFPAVQYIFYMPFHKIPFDIEADFLTFALKSCSCELVSSDQNEKCMKKLRNASNVVFIIDGLDLSEADTQFTTDQTCTESDLNSPNKPSFFINGLLSGTIFSNAKKLVTCSSASILKLSSSFVINSIVEIHGLDSTSQTKITGEICGENMVLQELHGNEDITLFCSNPLLCILLKSAMSLCANKGEATPLTKCFIETMKMYMYSQDEPCNKNLSNTLISIGEVAWRKFLQEDLSFGDSFSEANNVSFHSEQCTQLFLVTGVGNNECAFFNSIWKELFCAIYAVTVLPVAEFRKCINHLEYSNWKFMKKFLFGLHNPSVYNELKEVFSPIVFELWEKKYAMLTAFVIKSLAAVVNSNGACSELQKFFQVCAWLHETCDNKIMEKINPLLPEYIELNRIIKSEDVPGLRYVFAKADESISLRFGKDVKFIDGCLNYFLSSMEKVHEQRSLCQFANKDVRLTVLIELTSIRTNEHHFSNNICPVLHLCDLVSKIQDENWTQTVISSFPEVVHLKGTIPNESTHISNLISILQKLDKAVMFKFDQNITISDEVLLQLLKGVCVPPIKIKRPNSPLSITEHGSQIDIEPSIELVLNDSISTGDGFSVLEHVLSAFPSQVNGLVLFKSILNQCDLSSLSQCLHKVQRLDLRCCKINCNDLAIFLKSISSLPRPLQLLDLHFTELDKECLAALSNSIHNIGCVTLNDCRISTIDRIKEGMLVNSETSQSVKCLSFTRRIRDKYVIKIIDGLGLQNFDSLTLRECKITSSSVKVIFEKLKARTRPPMLNMELGFNKFGDKGLSYFSGSLHNVEKLSLWDCKITAKGVRILVKEILSLQSPMKKLDLSFNDIGNKGVAAICSCLQKIEELNLCWCGITSAGIKDLSFALLDLENPIKSLTLDENKFGEEGCLSLVDCIGKIRKLSIRQCDISYDGCLAMKEKISSFPEPKPSVTGVDVKRSVKVTATEL